MFLVDGSSKGVVTAEIMNWSGHALSAPRERLPEVLKRQEAKRTGVYILFGDPLDASGRREVYVGESDDVGKRLSQHNKDDDKDFFETFCLLTSKDQNLTKAHARYLENRITDVARRAGRAEILNRTEPTQGVLPESDVSDMEFFLSQVEIILPVLGYDVLRPSATTRLSEATSRDAAGPSNEMAGSPAALELRLRAVQRGMEADAVLMDGEVVVRAGSTADAHADHASNPVETLRDALVADGSLAPDPATNGKLLLFTRDVAFSSPSQAAAVIYARNANGRTAWRLKEGGQTLKDYQVSLTEAVE
ncbi:GIY-YIG nuclease family protein [Albimonas sp. CAU 1670]|uniref:GIY-YIG nuclease family protein n=1 Tax=Albimonas sp. CAU 1670 TaxID=3032599 RepID=UPI0023DC0AF9|nr:GIY-YIG nuclease family protein [Albimonas sp. CAU 1670]MDF2231943.1 GIY-YIG nuclease family protein [Albimonas sp. CAU 1670]